MSYILFALAGLIVATVGLWVEPMLIAYRNRRLAAGESDGESSDPNDTVPELDATRSRSEDRNPAMALVPLFGPRQLLEQPSKAEMERRNAHARMIPYWVQATILQVALAAIFVGLAWTVPHVRVTVHAHHSHYQFEDTLLACLYAAILFEIAVIDFHYRLVLNILSYPAMGIALAASFIPGSFGPISALEGGAVAFVLFYLIELVGRGAMARGDTKLAILIGLMSGFPAVLAALLLGILTGGAIAAGLLISGIGRKTMFAYGPALAVGGIISLFVAKH